MFRVYMRTSRSKFLPQNLLLTANIDDAIDHFFELVNCSRYDGADRFVVLTDFRRTIFCHDFSGVEQSWRGFPRDHARSLLVSSLHSH